MRIPPIIKSGFIFNAAVFFGFAVFAFLHNSVAHHTAHTESVSINGQLIDFNCTLGGVIPEVIKTGETDTTEWHGRYELPDRPFLWEPAEPGESILKFREAMRDRFGADIDSRELTNRQHDIFVTLPDGWRDEAVNAALLLDGNAGTITEMSCLEVMLWEWQNARFPMLEHPTEFGAFILKGHDHVRVYISSADLVGGKVSREVAEQMQADILAGYSLITHIHNHPFLFDREVGDRMWTTAATIDDIAGGLAPSMSDVGFYRSFRDSHGLQEAWITNGLHSSRFHASEFESLRARN